MTRPNILLITCHDLGRFLGCYGVETVHTPSFDRLANEGIRLARAYTTAPSCSPARAALATGRYPHANGVMGLTHPPFGWNLHPEERHMAQILGDAGYSTHLFGFQHVSTHDERPGYQYIHTDHNRGLALPVAAKVRDLLHAWHHQRPFYLEVNLEEPHRPYDQDDAVPDGSAGVTVPGYLPEGQETVLEVAALQGAVRQADVALACILAALRDSGLEHDTIVLFSADHGLAMPRAKCTLYDPGLEIAVLMRWPAGGITGGTALDPLISNIDLLPTLLELIDVPVPDRVQGRSFAGALRGEAFTGRTQIFAEKTYHSYYDPMRAVRTERFKYIRNFEPAPLVEIPADIAIGLIYPRHVALYTDGEHPPAELYDLHHDPLEQHNLLGSPQYEPVHQWLDTALTTWMRDTGDPLSDQHVATPGFAGSDATAGRPDAC